PAAPPTDTLSLRDALPILLGAWAAFWALARNDARMAAIHAESYAGYRARLGELLTACGTAPVEAERLAIMLTAMVDGLWLELSLDRKSTRLNSSHVKISYA